MLSRLIPVPQPREALVALARWKALRASINDVESATVRTMLRELREGEAPVARTIAARRAK